MNINTFGFSLPDFNGYKMSNLFGAMSSMVSFAKVIRFRNKSLLLELIHIPYRSAIDTELESKDYHFSYDSAVRHMK